jgi:predicted ATPase/DNA-binding winged helix-turn-helix (wHTH) protein
VPEEVLRFEEFELDRSVYQLRLKGRPVRLERIPLDLLFLLAERHGQLVSREEIVERIWGRHVFLDTNNAINTAIRKIRRALGDDSAAPRIVVTVPAKGYRFVAPVREPRSERAGTGIEKSVRPALSSFVGRERELAELRGGVEDAISGRGRLFVISGPPGVGKTRLVEELMFVAAVQRGGMTALAGHCIHQEGAVPYLPFVEILESYVGRVTQSASPGLLRSLLGEEGPELARLMPSLRSLLPELPAPLELPPDQARRHLFNCFCYFVTRLAKERPALLLLDDLHWADDSSLALLVHLAQRLPDLPLLVVGTYRDVEIDVTRALATTLENLLRGHRATPVRLKGLARDEVALMLKGLSGQAPPAAVVREIYAETEGNPFFVEELFRYLEEENRLYDAAGAFRPDLKVAEPEVPQTVRLVVGRRLARLTDLTRTVLGTAAVIGRSFAFEVLKAATATDGLLECVEETEKAGLIFSGAQSPEARFEFTHELIRQTLIGSLSAERRQRLHLEVASAIEQVHAHALEEHSTELAHHYGLGGNASKAVEFLERAAVRAAQQAAYSEAAGFESSAIDKLHDLPQSQQRDRLELRLLGPLILHLMIARGYGAIEVEAPLQRMRELAKKLEAGVQLFVASGLARTFYNHRRELWRSRQLAGEIAAMAERSGHPLALCSGAWHLAEEEFTAGEFVQARQNFERVLELSRDPSQKQGETSHQYWFSAFLLSATLFTMGYAQQARQKAAAAVQKAQAIGQPIWIAVSALGDANVHQLSGAPHRSLELTEQVLSIANDHGMSPISRLASYFRAMSLVRVGRVEEGTAQIRMIAQAEDPLLRVGATIGLASACCSGNHPEEGLRLLPRTLELIERTGERKDEALLHRIWGELLLMRGDRHAGEAERRLRTAIEVAKRQSAKFYQLLAAISLARLLGRQDRREEARAILADIYGWFTEGFDTAMLQEAKALLIELKHNA